MIYNDPALQKAAKEVTVAITTWTGMITSGTCVQYNGTSYSAAGSFKANVGDSIRCYVPSGGSSSNIVKVNGVQVYAQAGGLIYDYTLTGDIDIAVSGNFDFSTYFSTHTFAITTK